MARNWTTQEEETVLHIVKQHPDNLRFAFKVAEKQINRTQAAIVSRYYDILNKPIRPISKKQITYTEEEVKELIYLYTASNTFFKVKATKGLLAYITEWFNENKEK